MKTTKRKVVWDRGGVSEVIGTILTLSITVVLFSSIITMVNQFPAPGDTVRTDFMATVEPWNGDWNTGAFIHITNSGGSLMTGDWTVIVISIDSMTYTLQTKGTMPDDGRPYGLGPGVAGHRGSDNGDANWDTGERWTLPRDNTTISQSSDISVIILDAGRNALVWSAQIHGARNRFGPVISNVRVDSDLSSIRQEPVQFGREFYIFADAYDPDGDLDVSMVYADMSTIGLSDNVTMYHMGDGLYRSDAVMGPPVGSVPIGYHIVVVHAWDGDGMHSRATGRIAVGLDLKGQPNLVLHERNIRLSTESPTNRQVMAFTVTVINYGGSCNGTLVFYDMVDSTERVIAIENFTISDGPDQVTKTVRWTAGPGGLHTIRIETWPVAALDADPDDNIAYADITVMPTILLVDDDNHPADYTFKDAAGYMRGALDSCDFKYDLHIVGTAKDGPAYSFGERKLMDYDIVIWVTGYEKTNTLTEADRANLNEFLTNATTGRAGNLWMVSQYVKNNVPDAFMVATLKAESGTWNEVSEVSSIRGIAGNQVSSEWESTDIPLDNPTDHKSVWEFQPVSGANVTFTQDPLVPNTGIAVNYENTAIDSRLVFFPWEFSRISETGDQAAVAYRVLNWLGNLKNRTGQDLAVSEQSLDPPFVFFNQKVKVTAVIRNNGPNDLTAQAGLFLNGGNEPIEWKPTLLVPGNGGTVTVTGNWTATMLGTHVLKWRVDPNGLIHETNENNNEVSSQIESGEVFVEFRILVVDDDDSGNNGGSEAGNDTALLTDSLSRLDYLYEANDLRNTAYVVGSGDEGPDISFLKNYSAVLWVGGNSTSAVTDTDAYNIERYLLEQRGRVWLSGNDLFSGLAASNKTRFLGILGIADDGVTEDQPISGTMRGADDDPISHGMNISIADNALADTLELKANATGVFYRSLIAGIFTAVKYSENYHAFTCGFALDTLNGTQPGYISGKNATDELAFMFLRWTGRPETRNELRVTEKDYFIENWHPQIGGAYVLRARVHNVGANPANALVRFMDRNVQIGSDTVSIAPGAMTSAEIIWAPLFAGQRTISVLVDPIGDVDEIFMWFNNNVSFRIYVYFFWDDMESGAGKWSHASTIININGESPLDYYTASTPLFTDISSTWDMSLSYGLNDSTVAYSHPNSFYMKESTGLFGKADVLLSFAIDDSKSMQDRFDNGVSWLERAKDAAKALLEQLSDDSVIVSIWDFNGNMERRWFGPNDHPMTSNRYKTQFVEPVVRLGDAYMLSNGTATDGRGYIRQQITDMANPPGQTLLWDAIGGAYEDIDYYRAIYDDLLPVVVVLSDGMDLQASDESALMIVNADNKIECGSAFWGPWGNMADGEQHYDLHYGKYTLDWENPETNTFWFEALAQGSVDRDRYGLLHADFQIFTIGLGLEHHDDPTTPDVMEVWHPPTYTWPGNKVGDYLYAYCDDPSVPTLESGTLEYNLWRIADTSNASYFYAPDASELEDIFMELGMMLATGFNQTRSSEPAPETRAAVKNSDKRAVTEPFSLVNASKAQLSFWHKYKILQGGNGGFLQVGYKTSALGDWQFRYIVPPGQYTGMLYHQYDIYDDFGNAVKWCWNGVSGSGSFGWDYSNVDISPFVPAGSAADGHVYRSEVVVAFNYTQFGGGTGVGWYIDNVKLDVTRAEAAATDAATKDLWKLVGDQKHSGSSSWSNIDPATGHIKPGVDNFLVTLPIDLTGALNAHLSAYFMFNFNTLDGAPPDGFRVEVSGNGGVSWTAINQGVRSSEGVSGIDSGISYEGNHWIEASTLSRLDIDISAWIGSQILIRFRMVTNTQPGYLHFSDASMTGGFYVDDVNVYGDSIYG